MMATTHAAMGVALASPLVSLAPELAPAAALAAGVGGAFPDLDLLVGEHRKTLHFPVYYWPPALAAAALALAAPGPPTVAAAAFLLSAAVHSVTDVLGGGLGLRPWENDDRRGVWLHHANRWVVPRRWIRYDGAPEDLVLAALLSVPALVLFDGVVRWLALAGLVVSAAYTALRKRLPDIAPQLL